MLPDMAARAEVAAQGDRAADGTGVRRPWYARAWLYAGSFSVVFGVLLARNAFLFSTPLHEDADMGANSILIEQARRFSLLVGNYSREKFNHPGPAFLYVRSWGESLLWSALHVVPTAWNGQLIAVYALNALFAASVVAVVYGWTRSAGGGAAAFAVVALLGALHPAVFSSDWMPYAYVLAYLAFVVAITSVAAGRTPDLPAAAVAGWFCVHGHACFLVFVPVMTVCAAVALAWPRRRRLGAALRSFGATRRRDWVTALVISALFCVPIAAELAVHWPGSFGEYVGYGASHQAGDHPRSQNVTYVLWFWWPHGYAWAVALVLVAAAVAAAWWCPRGPARRLSWFLIAFDAVSLALILAYAAVGVDEINQHYIEYFAWTVPVVMVGALAVALTAAVPRGRALAAVATTATVAAAVAAGTAFAVAPQTRTSIARTDPADPAAGANTDSTLPAGVARLAALADGKPVVLRLYHDAWPEMTGILVQAERTGVTACVASPGWGFMVTSQFMCSPAELAAGRSFVLYPAQGARVARWTPVAFRFRRAVAAVSPPAHLKFR